MNYKDLNNTQKDRMKQISVHDYIMEWENPEFMRNRSTVSFIGLWELLHNPEFNCLEFEAIKKESGDNGFVMTPKRWIEVTGAVGIVSKQ